MSAELPDFSTPISLFPLPNVVLLPGSTLPLQIYEPRYRSMVGDVLSEGDPVMAMALLKPGYEAYYYTNLAAIHRVVCVGRIREHARTSDGRYFINLVGLCRARVEEEDREGEYRRAMLQPLVRPHSGIDADGEYAARQRCRQVLAAPGFEANEAAQALLTRLSGDVPLELMIDVIAGALLPMEAVEIRQRLLAESSLLVRADTVIDELHIILRTMAAQRPTDRWPPGESSN